MRTIFISFAIFCWISLIFFLIKFASQQRKKTFLLRSFLKMARNQSPERWTVKEDTEDSGFYEIDRQAREYSTETADFFLKIGKYSRYSYQMFISTKEEKEEKEEIGTIFTIFNGSRKIAKTYKQIDQERRRMEKIIEKWQGLGAKVRKNDVLENDVLVPA